MKCRSLGSKSWNSMWQIQRHFAHQMLAYMHGIHIEFTNQTKLSWKWCQCHIHFLSRPLLYYYYYNFCASPEHCFTFGMLMLPFVVCWIQQTHLSLNAQRQKCTYLNGKHNCFRERAARLQAIHNQYMVVQNAHIHNWEHVCIHTATTLWWHQTTRWVFFIMSKWVRESEQKKWNFSMVCVIIAKKLYIVHLYTWKSG